MENLLTNRFEDGLEEVKDKTRKLLDEVLMPYRRERSGEWVDTKIGVELRKAYVQSLCIGGVMLGEEEKSEASDYQGLRKYVEVAEKFARFLNIEIAHFFFLGNKRLIYVPDMVVFVPEISATFAEAVDKIIYQNQPKVSRSRSNYQIM